MKRYNKHVKTTKQFIKHKSTHCETIFGNPKNSAIIQFYDTFWDNGTICCHNFVPLRPQAIYG